MYAYQTKTGKILTTERQNQNRWRNNILTALTLVGLPSAAVDTIKIQKRWKNFFKLLKGEWHPHVLVTGPYMELSGGHCSLAARDPKYRVYARDPMFRPNAPKVKGYGQDFTTDPLGRVGKFENKQSWSYTFKAMITQAQKDGANFTDIIFDGHGNTGRPYIGGDKNGEQLTIQDIALVVEGLRAVGHNISVVDLRACKTGLSQMDFMGTNLFSVSQWKTFPKKSKAELLSKLLPDTAIIGTCSLISGNPKLTGKGGTSHGYRFFVPTSMKSNQRVFINELGVPHIQAYKIIHNRRNPDKVRAAIDDYLNMSETTRKVLAKTPFATRLPPPLT